MISTDVGRSSIFFDNLRMLYGIMDEVKFAKSITSMPCLVAYVKTESFQEAMDFLDYINGLSGNTIINRRKHLIIMTPTIDYGLMQNKTTTFGAHMISQDKTGKYLIANLNTK